MVFILIGFMNNHLLTNNVIIRKQNRKKMFNMIWIMDGLSQSISFCKSTVALANSNEWLIVYGSISLFKKRL